MRPSERLVPRRERARWDSSEDIMGTRVRMSGERVGKGEREWVRDGGRVRERGREISRERKGRRMNGEGLTVMISVTQITPLTPCPLIV